MRCPCQGPWRVDRTRARRRHRAATGPDRRGRRRHPRGCATSGRTSCPSARLGTTPTPGTSGSVKAPSGGDLAMSARAAGDATLPRARRPQRRAACRGRRHKRSGAASRLEPMRLAARSSSSAPVTTRRTSRTSSHFSASSSLRQALSSSGKVSRCTEPSSARLARQPRFLGGERKDRRQPGDERPEDLVDDGERGARASRSNRARSRARPCGCRNRTPTGSVFMNCDSTATTLR